MEVLAIKLFRILFIGAVLLVAAAILVLIPFEASAQYGYVTPTVSSTPTVLTTIPAYTPTVIQQATPSATASATSLPPAPLPSIPATPVFTSTPLPLPPTPTFSCATIEEIAYDAHEICTMVQQECDQAIQVRDSVCAGLPSVDLCDGSTDPNCDICQHAEMSAQEICAAAITIQSQVGDKLRDYVPEYVQQGCMGCYLDVGGINIYDPCVVNSPRPTRSGCP